MTDETIINTATPREVDINASADKKAYSFETFFKFQNYFLI
jgi:hypothetical protein